MNGTSPALPPRDDSAIKGQLSQIFGARTNKAAEVRQARNTSHGAVTDADPIDTKTEKTAKKKLAETATSKSGDQFQILDDGAVKKVWVRTFAKASGKADTSSVFYTAKKSFRNKKEKELRAEVTTMRDIGSVLTESEREHLAVRAEDVEEGGEVGGKFTVKTDKATGGNFEKVLRNRNTPMSSRRNFGLNFLHGLKNLGKAKYSYGDMKPENCMIYGDKGNQHLKIGDFGKARKGEGSYDYKGNTRFAPPEGKQSIQGDAWSGAMVLIRNFEESVMREGENSLMPMGKKDKNYDMKANKELRGVERFVVEHKAFLATNPGLSIKGLKNRFKMGKLNNKEMLAQQEAMHGYIDKLCARLVRGNRMNDFEAGKLKALLKEMTMADPQQRMSAGDALEAYTGIRFIEVS